MKAQNNDNKTKYAVIVLFILISFLKLYSCGGGVVPYVPTQSGATGASTASSQFFIFEKGVAIDMFNVKKHQPIFRNIILTGNERTKNKPEKKSVEKDSSDVASKEGGDSTAVSKDEEIVPVLNIHRLH